MDVLFEEPPGPPDLPDGIKDRPKIEPLSQLPDFVFPVNVGDQVRRPGPDDEQVAPPLGQDIQGFQNLVPVTAEPFGKLLSPPQGGRCLPRSDQAGVAVQQLLPPAKPVLVFSQGQGPPDPPPAQGGQKPGPVRVNAPLLEEGGHPAEADRPQFKPQTPGSDRLGQG